MADKPQETFRLNHLPSYATKRLWLRTLDGEARKVDPDGTFTLPISDHLELRWAHPDGPALTVWKNLGGDYQLEWDGKIRLAGFIDRTHFLEYHGLNLMLIELVGGAYPANYKRWPSLQDLEDKPFSRDKKQAEDPSTQNHWYSLVVALDSPLVDFTHHALVNGNAVDVVAQLGDEAGKWHELVAVPLILESLSLLSSRF